MLTIFCDVSFPSGYITRIPLAMSHHRPLSIYHILIPWLISIQSYSKNIQDCIEEYFNQFSPHPFLSCRISIKLYERALALDNPHIWIGKCAFSYQLSAGYLYSYPCLQKQHLLVSYYYLKVKSKQINTLFFSTTTFRKSLWVYSSKPTPLRAYQIYRL